MACTRSRKVPVGSGSASLIRARRLWLAGTTNGSPPVSGSAALKASVASGKSSAYPLASGSFLVAVSNNYAWNRVWSFRGQRGHVVFQGLRFLVVSAAALCANLVMLYVLVRLGAGELLAQALAIVIVTPVNFVGNKLWSFRRS